VKVLVRDLDPAVIALCGLNVVLHAVAKGDSLTKICDDAGLALAGECWAAGLTKENPKLAERIERYVRLKHSNVKVRRQAVRSIAKRQGYEVKHWPRKARINAGNWLVDCVTDGCKGLFVLVGEDGKGYTLALEQGVYDDACIAIDEVVERNPVGLPLLVE